MGKKTAIIISIAAVLIGSAVFTLLLIRKNRLSVTEGPPQTTTPVVPGSSTNTDVSATSTPASPETNQFQMPPEQAFKDSDQDRLTDVEEGQVGTDPHKADTDGDGLSDFEEVRGYCTDPNNPETHGINDKTWAEQQAASDDGGGEEARQPSPDCVK